MPFKNGARRICTTIIVVADVTIDTSAYITISHTGQVDPSD